MEGEAEEKGSVRCSSEGDVIGEMMEVIENVGSYAAFRRTQRKESLSLVRRLKLLVPLLEELRELRKAGVSVEASVCLAGLKAALVSAKKLLKYCNYGSKIYLAQESEAVAVRFPAVYDKLNQALDDLPCNDLRSGAVAMQKKDRMGWMRLSGPPGDLSVYLDLEEIQRDGINLRSTVSISYLDAILGAVVKYLNSVKERELLEDLASLSSTTANIQSRTRRQVQTASKRTGNQKDGDAEKTEVSGDDNDLWKKLKDFAGSVANGALNWLKDNL